MSEQVTVLNNTVCGVVEETTAEGTAETVTTSDGVLLRADAVAFNLGRELIDINYMTGSLSKTSPLPGMYNDDIGATMPVYLRGGASSEQPDYHVLLESVMGAEYTGYAATDINDPGGTAKTTAFTVTDGSNIQVGQIIKVGLTSGDEYTRVITKSTHDLTVWPPLSSVPADEDAVTLGTNYILADSGWPTFTSDIFFDGSKKLQFTGCRVSSASMNFTVGQPVTADFTMQALTPTLSYATATAFDLDTATNPPTCLGISLKTTYAGTAKGTPSTTETILSEPDYEVAIGDEIMIDVGTNEFETVAITNVSGNAGSDVTLTHAAVSVAASADDTVYIIRDRCAGIGDSIALTIEMTRETINCMQSSSGKQASTFTERSVTVEKTPYFKSWQEFLLRDAVVGTELTIVLGSATYNTMVLYMPNVINAEVELGAETLMKNNVSGRAVIGSRLGEGYELAIAHF